MNISATVKRECKFNGSTYEDIELTQEDIEQALIRKCESNFSDNTGCTFSIENIQFEEVK